MDQGLPGWMKINPCIGISANKHHVITSDQTPCSKNGQQSTKVKKQHPCNCLQKDRIKYDKPKINDTSYQFKDTGNVQLTM